MSQSVKAFTAGALGAVILAAIMFGMFFAKTAGEPGFVAMFREVCGEMGPLDFVLGTLGFLIAGGIWAVIYSFMVERPGVITGMLYGFVPTLFLWVVISPLMTGKFFYGFDWKALVFPVAFNVIVWGGFVGWYLSRGKSAEVPAAV